VLVRWPAKIASGSRCEAIITNVDFAVTFLDMCDIEATTLPSQQGRSFLPLLRGETVDDWPTSMYYRYWEHDDPYHHVPAHYGVRTERYKLIRYYGAPLGVPGSSERITPDEWEMFDLETDPLELTNIINDPGHRPTAQALKAELARLIGRTSIVIRCSESTSTAGPWRTPASTRCAEPGPPTASRTTLLTARRSLLLAGPEEVEIGRRGFLKGTCLGMQLVLTCCQHELNEGVHECDASSWTRIWRWVHRARTLTMDLLWLLLTLIPTSRST